MCGFWSRICSKNNNNVFKLFPVIFRVQFVRSLVWATELMFNLSLFKPKNLKLRVFTVNRLIESAIMFCTCHNGNNSRLVSTSLASKLWYQLPLKDMATRFVVGNLHSKKLKTGISAYLIDLIIALLTARYVEPYSLPNRNLLADIK